MDHLGLRMRYCPGEVNQPRSNLFLLREGAAAVSYHLAPPCLPDNLCSCPAGPPANRHHSRASVLDSHSSLSLECPHSLTPLALDASYPSSRPRLVHTSSRQLPLAISSVRVVERRETLQLPRAGPKLLLCCLLAV